jgi:hypothetical protein
MLDPRGVAPDAAVPATIHVTHLAKKALPMRHKISSYRHNPLKNNTLQRQA